MRLFTDNPDFYPTPEAVIQQMMIGTDIAGKTVLEPSAGTGNIVDWLKANGAREVIACENDPHIRKLLNGKCEIIAEDFLTVTSDMVSHIDCIVMNPPFSSGAKHILHAWQIAPPGCSIVALCNSSNLESYNRRDYQELQETIELYGNSEWLGEVFKDDAERRTRVSVSLVKLYKGGEGDNEWDGYFFSSVDEDAANSNETEGIMQYNVVRELVNRYVSAVKLFDDTMNVARRINETAEFIDYYIDDKGEQQKRTYGSLPIKFCAVTGNERSTYITHDQYKKELQKYYWNIIFKKLNMEKYATQSLMAQINRFIEMQKHVPFTMGNVYRVIDMVIQTTGQRMQKALLEAFDHICSFSAENSTAGEKWKTNANYMVNKKFIVPYICSTYDYDTRKACLSLSWSREGSLSKLEDVNKALCYITGTNYDEVKSLSEAVRKEYPLWGEWFNWGFFRCKGYKKGTMHFEFLKGLQNELNTQETDGNAQPVFWGVMETKETGVPEGCGEPVIYMGDGATMTLPEVLEYIEDYIKLLNEERRNEWKAIDKNDMNEVVEFMHEVFGWNEVRIVDIDKKEELSMMTGAFITKRACKEYIEKYGYNHSRPKTFAMTAFRNHELERLLIILRTMKMEG